MDLFVDPKLVVPNDKITLADGCIKPWSSSSSLYYAQTLSSLAKHYKFSLSDPWKKIPKKFKILFYMVLMMRKSNFHMMMVMENILVQKHLKELLQI